MNTETISLIRKRCDETKEISLQATKIWQSSQQRHSKLIKNKQYNCAKKEHNKMIILKRISDFWCSCYKQDRDWILKYSLEELSSSDFKLIPTYFLDYNSTEIRKYELEEKKYWWSIGASKMADQPS